MSIISWIVVALIAAFVGGKSVNTSAEKFFLDIDLGIVGAVIGFSMNGMTGSNLYDLTVAVIGGAVFFFVYDLIRRLGV